MHPLDTHDRRELAQGAAGIGMCNITKCCTEVCPEGIKITDNAIIPMKERVVDKKFDPLVWLGNKIGVRNKDYDGRDEVCSACRRASSYVGQEEDVAGLVDLLQHHGPRSGGRPVAELEELPKTASSSSHAGWPRAPTDLAQDRRRFSHERSAGSRPGARGTRHLRRRS